MLALEVPAALPSRVLVFNLHRGSARGLEQANRLGRARRAAEARVDVDDHRRVDHGRDLARELEYDAARQQPFVWSRQRVRQRRAGDVHGLVALFFNQTGHERVERPGRHDLATLQALTQLLAHGTARLHSRASPPTTIVDIASATS